MDAIDRRSALRSLLGGAVATGLGGILLASPAAAVPLALEKDLGRTADDLMEKAQPVQVAPRPIPHHRRRRHRRRVCWWHRGRRVCAWR